MGRARWSTEGSGMEKAPRNSSKDGNSSILAQRLFYFMLRAGADAAARGPPGAVPSELVLGGGLCRGAGYPARCPPGQECAYRTHAEAGRHRTEVRTSTMCVCVSHASSAHGTRALVQARPTIRHWGAEHDQEARGPRGA